MLTLFFIVLSMFCIQKQVSKFLATCLATHSWVASFGYSFGDSLTSSEFIQRLLRLTTDSSHDSPSRQTSRIIFLKDFSRENYFKLLSSSLKPLLQYFYIKTQPIWMVFHSINISKVILNSFHWFWLLDYVLESFCALGWDFHHKGRENIIFVNFFVWDLFLLMIFFRCWPLVAKRICIKGGFHDVHALFLFMFLVCFMVLWVIFSIYALLFSLRYVCVFDMHTSLCYYASLNACSDDHLLCYVTIVVICIWLFWCMIKLFICFTSWLLDRNLLVTLYLSFYYLLYLEGLMCFVQVFQVTSIYVPSSSQLLDLGMSEYCHCSQTHV